MPIIQKRPEPAQLAVNLAGKWVNESPMIA